MKHMKSGKILMGPYLFSIVAWPNVLKKLSPARIFRFLEKITLEINSCISLSIESLSQIRQPP